MCRVGLKTTTLPISDNTIVKNNNQQKAEIKNDIPKQEIPLSIIAPKDNLNNKELLPDNFKHNISFNGKIPPKSKETSEPQPKKEEGHGTSETVQHIAHDAHGYHVKYEAAVATQKVVSNAANTSKNMGRVLLVSGEITQAASKSQATKVAMSGVKATATISATVGKALTSTANALHAAHHGTEAVQGVVLKTTSNVLAKVGATSASAKVAKLIPHAAHATHGAVTAAKTTATVAKGVKAATTVAKVGSVALRTAGVVGKVMPGVGFAAGMVGAGFAINDAKNAKTTAGKVAHTTRAILSATAGVASFVPGVGTAIGIGATVAEIGIGWAAKKFGWN